MPKKTRLERAMTSVEILKHYNTYLTVISAVTRKPKHEILGEFVKDLWESMQHSIGESLSTKKPIGYSYDIISAIFEGVRSRNP